jgi:hypothetical protein
MNAAWRSFTRQPQDLLLPRRNAMIATQRFVPHSHWHSVCLIRVLSLVWRSPPMTCQRP